MIRSLFLGVGASLIGLAFPCLATLPADLDASIQRGMEEWKLPGLAIAVVEEGKVVLAKGYGVRKVGKPEPVDAETLFAIGSTSKAFTSAAIGTLVDAGKLAWDTPVSKLWPEFKLSDPWVTREIRVSDLLANRSGLNALSEALWYGTGYDRDEIIRRLQFVPIDEGFRYQFQYRNTMFLTAGQLIPKVTGKSWDETVKEALFEPLGMSRSRTSPDGLDAMENVASPHIIGYDGKPLPIAYREMTNIGPAGSIVSCVRDLAHWVQLHLARGKFGDRQILKPETVSFIHRSQTPLSTTGPAGQPLTPSVDLPAYALAWVTESYRGERVVWHNGDIDGMSAWVGLLPERNVGVVILANLDACELRTAIFYGIVDHVIGKRAEALESTLIQKHRAALKARDAAETEWQSLVKTPRRAELPLDRYTGSYSNPAFGIVEISLENGSLVYKRTAEQTLDLAVKEKNVFTAKYRNSTEDLRSGKEQAAFIVKDGKVVELVEDDAIHFTRID